MKLEIKIDAGGFEENLRKDKASNFKSWEDNAYKYLYEEVRDIEEGLTKIISGSYNGRIVKCIGIRYYFDWTLDKRLNLKYLTFLCEIPEEGRTQEIVKGALTFL